ncbi:MAG: hypothetical protein ACR5LD_00845 [Symbiopectobacterium sp.]
MKWRILLEQTLEKYGTHLYQKLAVTRDGVMHHREIMPRITDGVRFCWLPNICR